MGVNVTEQRETQPAGTAKAARKEHAQGAEPALPALPSVVPETVLPAVRTVGSED